MKEEFVLQAIKTEKRKSESEFSITSSFVNLFPHLATLYKKVSSKPVHRRRLVRAFASLILKEGM